MTDSEFFRIGEFIQKQCGIKMPLSKKIMVQGRLHKRVRLLHLPSFGDYADYVFSPAGTEEELYHMIDAVTTNKTDFFRESKHFDFLTAHVLPRGGEMYSTTRHMQFWSAGCSTGEEPYTLAMVLAEHARRHPSFHFSITATDISTKVLRQAATAIYPHDKIEPVPMALRKQYLLKSRNGRDVRIAPGLRACVKFARLNFMDTRYAMPDAFDAVFCRNVIIYFDRQTQEAILQRICRHLAPGGYLFMGHSETLNGMNLPLQLVTSSIYRKRHDDA
ncbi:MAG: chemotaxis protein CheR [Deltaproteobacteria bacterium HGW-Deltaproteobacteria-6]|jgi:chemotaxis protein methyltransferase CheR|nr:MAG: chemotaxis protein CheR [Deltaproteobacteria bacterium HGW-Deltaproteobacteria-6]